MSARMPIHAHDYSATTEAVADHRAEEFYAWNDFKQDFRAVKMAGNELLDGLDDFGADLSEGLDSLFDFSSIETEADFAVDLSRWELRRQEWQ